MLRDFLLSSLLALAAACANPALREPTARGPRLMAEWEPALGTLIAFPFELPDALVLDLARESKLYVFVRGEDREMARRQLATLGAPAGNVEFIASNSRTPWTRDWGPHQVEQPSGVRALVDHVFRGYPWIPADATPADVTYRFGGHAGDDAATGDLARALSLPVVELPAIATGGNLLTDGGGRAFCTRAQIVENASTLDEAAYRELLRERLGVDELVVLENTEEFGIQHIDCWLKVLDPNTLLVKRAPADHPEHAPIERNVERLGALRAPFGEPYRILRIDCPRFERDAIAAYTNSLLVNGVLHVPLFGIEGDERALQTYRDALPGVEVRGYLHADWRYFDALHCRTRALFAEKR